MGQRVIPVAVTAEYIGGDGVTLGAAGSHNSVLIEYDFRSAGPQWDDISGRYVLWTNPQGNSTNRINLGVSEKVEGYEGVYQAAPPADAMCVPGWAEMVVVGFTLDGDKEVTKIKTEPSRFRVLPGSSRAADNEGVAPTVADQLQAEIEAVEAELDDKKVNKPVSPLDADGKPGQILESLGNGKTRWRDEKLASQEAIDAVLADHLDWVTTVQDRSLTGNQFALGALGYVTPEMFGAVCDGIADDSQYIQEAIYEGVRLGVPAVLSANKVYKFTTNIFLPSYTHLTINGTLLGGLGASSFETFDRVNATPLNTASHDVVIDGFGTINMQGYLDDASVATPLRIHHAKDILIKDITITDNKRYHMIEAGGTDGLVIDGVKFKGTHVIEESLCEMIQLETVTSVGASYAIPYDDTPTTNVVIKNCSFGESDHGGLLVHAIGEHSEVNDSLKRTTFGPIDIDNCSFMHSSLHPNRGDGIENINSHLLAFGSNWDRVCVNNCRFENIGASLLYVGRYTNSVEFNRNAIKNLYGDGVHLSTDIESCVISDNIFDNFNIINGGGSVATFCILYKSDGFAKITDNYFKSSQEYSNRPIFVLPSQNSPMCITNNVFALPTVDESYLKRYQKVSLLSENVFLNIPALSMYDKQVIDLSSALGTNAQTKECKFYKVGKTITCQLRLGNITGLTSETLILSKAAISDYFDIHIGSIYFAGVGRSDDLWASSEYYSFYLWYFDDTGFTIRGKDTDLANIKHINMSFTICLFDDSLA